MYADDSPEEPVVYELRKEPEVPAYVEKMSQILATIAVLVLFTGALFLFIKGVFL